MRKGPTTLARAVARLHPHITEPEEVIRSGLVLVDGRVVQNPRSMVGSGTSIVVAQAVPLRGEAKLRAAVDAFDVPVEGRVALDLGAAAGGFTRVLLEHGARRVYAVDAGHGQLLGSLRQDARVVNLEATNLGDLNHHLIPESVDVVTIDLSYLSLTVAAPQVRRVDLARGADLIALVKPMFELGLSRPPEDTVQLQEALARAKAGIEAAGWRVGMAMDSPVRGARGAVEFLVHARHCPG